jgi:hypothetical protein
MIWRGLASGVFALTIAAVALAASAIAAPPAGETPQAFLDAIYKTYLGKDSNGIVLDKPAVIRRYFVAPLAAAMIKDNAAAAKRGEVPELDCDPFINGQDWDISDLAIKVEMQPPDKALGTATFINSGTRMTVTYDLVQTAAGWRIADIRNGKRSVRAMYKVK